MESHWRLGTLELCLSHGDRSKGSCWDSTPPSGVREELPAGCPGKEFPWTDSLQETEGGGLWLCGIRGVVECWLRRKDCVSGWWNRLTHRDDTVFYCLPIADHQSEGLPDSRSCGHFIFWLFSPNTCALQTKIIHWNTSLRAFFCSFSTSIHSSSTTINAISIFFNSHSQCRQKLLAKSENFFCQGRTPPNWSHFSHSNTALVAVKMREMCAYTGKYRRDVLWWWKQLKIFEENTWEWKIK